MSTDHNKHRPSQDKNKQYKIPKDVSAKEAERFARSQGKVAKLEGKLEVTDKEGKGKT